MARRPPVTHMSTLVLLLAAVVTVAAAAVNGEQPRKTHRVSTHVVPSLRSKQFGCATGVNYRFEKYVPSKWEETSSILLNDDACQQIKRDRAEVVKWLHHTENAVSNRVCSRQELEVVPTQTALHKAGSFDKDIFSYFLLQNVCTGAKADDTIAVPIEPLIGHLRHPYASCASNERDLVYKTDVTYLLMHAWPMDAFHANYPGKKYLFDMGTSTFNTSLRFMTNRYRQAGIVFDEIWAWELAGYDPQEYWSVVPDDYVSRLHFYNTGFDINTSHAAHPMNIIRAIYRPGDVVIIKLDIDNSPLELSVIKEIEENPNLAKMITEMFFEMHYDHPHMAEFGFDNGRTLWDVVARFKALRKAGLILHYWP